MPSSWAATPQPRSRSELGRLPPGLKSEPQEAPAYYCASAAAAPPCNPATLDATAWLIWHQPRYACLTFLPLSAHVPCLCLCRYERALRQNNAVDFDDLLGLTVALLRRRDDVRERYQRRFK